MKREHCQIGNYVLSMLIVSTGLIGGCADCPGCFGATLYIVSRDRLDFDLWEQRVGKYSSDQAEADLGRPAAQSRLKKGGTVTQWVRKVPPSEFLETLTLTFNPLGLMDGWNKEVEGHSWPEKPCNGSELLCPPSQGTPTSVLKDDGKTLNPDVLYNSE